MPKDSNSVSPIQCLGDDGKIYPLQIDPVIGYVLIELYAEGSGSAVSDGTAKKDQNSVSTILCETDTIGNLTPTIDYSNNYLHIDLLIT